MSKNFHYIPRYMTTGDSINLLFQEVNNITNFLTALNNYLTKELDNEIDNRVEEALKRRFTAKLEKEIE